MLPFRSLISYRSNSIFGKNIQNSLNLSCKKNFNIKKIHSSSTFHVNTFKNVKIALKENGVAVISLNRPKSRNALSTALAQELVEIFQNISNGKIFHEPTGKPVKAVVLTGTGNTFCAGADLKERENMTNEQWKFQHKVFQNVVTELLNLPCPSISAINGHAFGGGFELALTTDWAMVNKQAIFKFPEVKLGIFPGMGGTSLLPRLIGLSNARRCILTGRSITAQEALDMGIVCKITEDGPSALLEAIIDADVVAKNAPFAVSQAKRAIWEGGAQMENFTDGWTHSLKLYEKCAQSNERLEGIKAYHEKREPSF